MKKSILLFILLSQILHADVNLSIREKCEIISDYAPDVYQRYIDGKNKDYEYMLVDKVTVEDNSLNQFMKGIVDIVYDIPKLKDENQVKQMKINLRDLMRKKCINNSLDQK